MTVLQMLDESRHTIDRAKAVDALIEELLELFCRPLPENLDSRVSAIERRAAMYGYSFADLYNEAQHFYESAALERA